MKASVGLFGIVPSSLNMVSCALRSRMAWRTERADGFPIPVTISSVFFKVSIRYMIHSPSHQPSCRTEVPLQFSGIGKQHVEAVFMLAGKAAIVTGSTSGIGLGIATALAEQKVHVMLNG